MPALQSRAPRLNLSFPLEFSARGSACRGNCLNVSESGLLGVFQPPPELWTTGELVLRLGETAFKLGARVARVHDNEAGLVFVVRSESDREAIRTVLSFAAQKTHVTGAPPF